MPARAGVGQQSVGDRYRVTISSCQLSRVPVSTAALWIAPAVGAPEGVEESIDRTVNQPIEYRVAVLSEL